MSTLLPYFVARDVAHRLDARGVRPGIALRIVVGLGSVAVLGMVACIAVFLGSAALWSLGVIN